MKSKNRRKHDGPINEENQEKSYEFLDDTQLKKDLVNAKNVNLYRQDSDKRIRVSVVPPQVYPEKGYSSRKHRKTNGFISKLNKS